MKQNELVASVMPIMDLRFTFIQKIPTVGIPALSSIFSTN